MKRKREAKPAPVMVPYQREVRGAASSKQAIRTRIALIAAERGLPESETKWAGRLGTLDAMRFAKKHRVNMDWLLCGDLKGLLETMRGCPSRPQRPVLDPWFEAGSLLRKLNEQKLLADAVECMRLLIERHGDAS
jgi:hypothetical protein